MLAFFEKLWWYFEKNSQLSHFISDQRSSCGVATCVAAENSSIKKQASKFFFFSKKLCPGLKSRSHYLVKSQGEKGGREQFQQQKGSFDSTRIATGRVLPLAMAGVFDIDIDDGMQRVSLMKFAFKIGSSDSFTNSESTN